MVLSRSSWSIEDQAKEVALREGESIQLTNEDVIGFLPEGFTIGDVVVIHLPGMSATLVPRLQVSPSDQSILVRQFNRVVNFLHGLFHGMNLLIVHRGAEGGSIQACWPANLLSLLAYGRQKAGIENLVMDGATDRLFFYPTLHRPTTVYTFHLLTELVNRFSAGRFGWYAGADPDDFILELMRRCLVYRFEISYQHNSKSPTARAALSAKKKALPKLHQANRNKIT